MPISDYVEIKTDDPELRSALEGEIRRTIDLYHTIKEVTKHE